MKVGPFYLEGSRGELYTFVFRDASKFYIADLF